MRTYNVIILVSIFSLLTFFATAGSAGSHRPVSKEVQKISNKDWLLGENLLTVSSVGYPSLTLSKEVVLTSNRITKESLSGNMISLGYPVWTISKGVHKITRPLKSEKKREPQLLGPAPKHSLRETLPKMIAFLESDQAASTKKTI